MTGRGIKRQLASTAQRLIWSDRRDRGREAAQLFTVVAVAASGWGLIYPHPYALAMGLLALLPWLAILIAQWRRARQRITFGPISSCP